MALEHHDEIVDLNETELDNVGGGALPLIGLVAAKWAAAGTATKLTVGAAGVGVAGAGVGFGLGYAANRDR